jgi:solute:Na+ symporter, SSS family
MFVGSFSIKVLYGTTEMGANPQLSWFGVIGYSGASAIPALIVGFGIGPQMRSLFPDKAFSATDFVRERYGRIMQIVMACVSGFYMFIFIVAELTSISAIFQVITNSEQNKWFGIGITLGIIIFVTLYTTIAGLPASIVTDKFQGIVISLLVLLLTFAVTLHPENKVSRNEFQLASNFTSEGFQAAITLIIAISCAELFNQGTWQRVWAADSVHSLRKGFAIGSVLVFGLMMFFGVMGMISYAKDPYSYENGLKYAYLSFFDLLLPLGEGWHIITLILVTALATSSIDTLQNGIMCVFSHDLVQFGWNPKLLSRVLLLLIDIPAMYIASKKYSVISLFLVADLVCATSVLPVFCGLQRRDYGIFKAPTELGSLLGCISGVVAVLINGVINNADGGLFEYFWLQNGAICQLCGTKTMVSFIVTPIVSIVMMYFFTYIDILVRGDRAREPIIFVRFDHQQQQESDLEMVDNDVKDIEEEEGLAKDKMNKDHDDGDKEF